MLPTDVLLDWKGRVIVDLYGYRIVDVQSKPETDVPNGDASRSAGSVSGGGSFHSLTPSCWQDRSASHTPRRW